MSEYQVYLAEIQKKLVSALVVFGIGLGGGFLFSNKILIFCLHVFNFSGVNVTVTSPTQLIDLSIYTGILCGFVVTLPFLTYEIINFVKPAFREKEYRLIKKLLPISIGLFLFGTIFGAWVTQLVIEIYSRFSAEFEVNNIWDIQKFFSQVLITAVCTGVIFQMPVVITILIRLKLVSRNLLASKRRYVYAILMLIGVMLPPTDILSLLFLVTPLLFLFEIALLLNIDTT